MKAIAEQIILVTGATDGIGRITARKFAELGATVLIHGRSRDKCEATVAEIRARTGNARLQAHVRDLASLAEVRRLAEEVLARNPRLDVLINNAAAGPKPGGRVLSADGHELCFAVNYLAPLLLTHLLLPALKNAAPSRIVNVASAAQQRIDFNNVMLERGYDPYRAYAQSKLALAMLTFDLANCLGQEITANCLHPGSLLDTKMVREGGYMPRGSARSGADVVVHVATSPELAGTTGQYFDRTEPARAHGQAYEPEARERLRQLGGHLTGIGEAGGPFAPS